MVIFSAAYFGCREPIVFLQLAQVDKHSGACFMFRLLIVAGVLIVNSRCQLQPGIRTAMQEAVVGDANFKLRIHVIEHVKYDATIDTNLLAGAATVYSRRPRFIGLEQQLSDRLKKKDRS